MRFHFYKMHGAGNDFLILDYMKEEEGSSLKASEVRYLCDRHFGIGADGVVVLNRSRIAHGNWKFFNSDGNEAEMCGNAARCVIRFLSEKYFPEEPMISLETKVGIIKGKVMDDTGMVEVMLLPTGQAKFEYRERVLKIGDEALRVYSIDTGVPHAVIEVKDIRNYPISKVGKFLVGHEAFQPEGTNVTFLQSGVGQQIWATTFERGVEEETMACGTGAAAAAIIYSELYLQPLPVEVAVPGGTLIVDLSPVAKMLLLRGPTEHVMEVELDDIPQDYELRRPYEYSGNQKNET